MPTEADLDASSQASSNRSVNSRKAEKHRKMTKSGWAYTGSEYSSKKASGDLKQKGKLKPYAYWPLNYKMVSRRPEHRPAARKGMSSMVKLSCFVNEVDDSIIDRFLKLTLEESSKYPLYFVLARHENVIQRFDFRLGHPEPLKTLPYHDPEPLKTLSYRDPEPSKTLPYRDPDVRE
ncbi:hypothetical protein Tco_0850479 [Tanacetum coccineum]